MRVHLALAGLVVPVACALGQMASAASAAPSTCQSLPATITADGGPVTGTEGDDVISTIWLVDISALGGNDVICVEAGRVDAGAGNDSVQSLSAAPSSSPVAIVTVLGDGDDTLAVSAGRYDASLGAGADRVVIGGFDISGSFNGGAGRDGLLFTDTTRIEVDLHHGGVAMGGQTFGVTGIEDVTATADRITIRGDSKRNTFDLTGCIVKGYGGGGNDALGLGSPNGVQCARRNLKLYGEGGNDRLTGNRLSNVLVGGGGRDAAYGKRGRDRCAAEAEAGWELDLR
jgi:Ca2+-binding RTX toxin-like protein